jgi:hypothetical protein
MEDIEEYAKIREASEVMKRGGGVSIRQPALTS